MDYNVNPFLFGNTCIVWFRFARIVHLCYSQEHRQELPGDAAVISNHRPVGPMDGLRVLRPSQPAAASTGMTACSGLQFWGLQFTREKRSPGQDISVLRHVP
jgi:hypothetical protein